MKKINSVLIVLGLSLLLSQCKNEVSTVMSVVSPSLDTECEKEMAYDVGSGVFSMTHSMCIKYADGSVDRPHFSPVERTRFFFARSGIEPNATVKDMDLKFPTPCNFVVKSDKLAADCLWENSARKTFELGWVVDGKFIVSPKFEGFLGYTNAQGLYKRFTGTETVELTNQVMSDGVVVFAPKNS